MSGDGGPVVALAVTGMAAVLATVAGVLVYRWRHSVRMDAAERLGLAYTREREPTAAAPGIPGLRLHSRDRLVGTWRDRQVRIDFPVRARGEHAEAFTRLVVEGVALRGVRLLLTAPTLGTKLGEALGVLHDLRAGDPAFDARWRIQGAPEEAARRLLGGRALRDLLAEPGRVRAVLLDEGRIEVARRGRKDDAEALRQLLDLGTDLARAVA